MIEKNKYDVPQKLKEEVSRLKEYLETNSEGREIYELSEYLSETNSTKEEIYELSEYLKTNSRKPPKNSKATLIDWSESQNISNLIIVSLEEKEVVSGSYLQRRLGVTAKKKETRIKLDMNSLKGRKAKTDYLIGQPAKKDKKQKKELRRAFAKTASFINQNVSPPRNLSRKDKNLFRTQIPYSLGVRSGYLFSFDNLASNIDHYYAVEAVFDFNLPLFLKVKNIWAPSIQSALSFEGLQTNLNATIYRFSFKAGPHWLFPIGSSPHFSSKRHYLGSGLLIAYTFETTID